MNKTDIQCSSSLYDLSLFPSVTSKADFNLAAYTNQVQGIEDASGNTVVTLNEALFPSLDYLKSIETQILQHTGDPRFTGKDAYKFTHSIQTFRF